jgi:hypothetical protein
MMLMPRRGLVILGGEIFPTGPLKFGGLYGNRRPPDDLFFSASMFLEVSKEVSKYFLKKSQKAF